MQIIGKWLRRVDTEEGRAEFKKTYKIDFYEYMINHQVTHITRLFSKNIAHVVFIDSYQTSQIFSLQENEHLMVYSDGCMSDEDRVFNTDGMAFMSLVRDCKVQSIFCIEDSPYDQEESDWEGDLEMTKETAIQNLNKTLQKYNVVTPATADNTLFVRQL